MKIVSQRALAALLIGASTHLHAATFSDDNWISMNGHPGVDDDVAATVVDASGNLYIAGAFTVAGDVFVTNIVKWDGTHWSAIGSGLNGGVSALAVSGHDVYAAGYFTTAGGIPATNIAKWNGTNWSPLGAGITGDYTYSLAVSGNDVYVSGYYLTNAGDTVVNRIAKWNGSSWSALGSGLSGGGARSLAVLGSDLYVGGNFTNAGGVLVNRIARWNGSSWSALGSGVEGPYANVSALAVSGGDLYVAGYFSTAGGIAATNMAKWNGSSWSVFPWPFYDADGQVLGAGVWDLAVSDNDLYAAGIADTDISSSGYYGYVVKWNGTSWSPLGPGMYGALHDAWDPVVSTVAVSGTNVYAGGAFTVVGNRWIRSCLVRWNGNEWSAVDPSAGPNSVSAMASSGNEVYAAGSFTRADGSVSDYVGRWNGSGWSPLGPGSVHNVTALAALGSDVYAAGTFTNVGITANIARWNGNSWSAVGSGVGRMANFPGPTVYALAVSGHDLYAAGYFTTAGGVAATNVARWNGTNWIALGWTGSPYWPVYALAVSGSNLYAGGAFSAADGSPGNFIARWNGSSWSALGSGMGGSPSASGFVQALAVMNGDLYAAGDFSTAGGVGAQCVAKWDGSSWSGLDSGMTRDDWIEGEHEITPRVRALAVSGNHLYVGGLFNTAGNAHVAEANYIARWDGSSWSALGSGMDYGVNLLTASGDELFTLGNFKTAGGKLSPNLARARIGSRAQGLTVSNGAGTLRFSGVTGYEYDVQRTTSFTPPFGQQ